MDLSDQSPSSVPLVSSSDTCIRDYTSWFWKDAERWPRTILQLHTRRNQGPQAGSDLSRAAHKVLPRTDFPNSDPALLPLSPQFSPSSGHGSFSQFSGWLVFHSCPPPPPSQQGSHPSALSTSVSKSPCLERPLSVFS